MFKELVKWTDGDTGEATSELLKGALVNFKRSADIECLKSSELYDEDELIATYDIEKGYKWIKPKFTISKELAALVEEKRGKYSLAQEIEERGEDRFKFFDVNKEMWDMSDSLCLTIKKTASKNCGTSTMNTLQKLKKKEDRSRGKVEDSAQWLYETFIKEKPEPVGIELDPENAIKCAFCGGINIQVKRVDGDLITFLCNACANAAQGKEVTFVKEAHKGL